LRTEGPKRTQIGPRPGLGCLREDEWLADLAFLPFALWASWSLFAVRGMPMTHDGFGLSFVEAYRRAYLAGDFFPLWTSFAEKGHGSQFPILYHRLHAQLFGAAAVFLGSLRALKLSIPILLVVGAAGMRRLCGALGSRPWVGWIGGFLLLSSNYAVSDWFVRGAVAEFTAFMLVPWCLRHVLELFTDSRAPLRLALSFTLLFYAHMTTFTVFALIAGGLIVGGLLRLRRFGWERLRSGLSSCALVGVIVGCAIVPYALAVKYVYESSGITTIGMRPDAGAYSPWASYFKDPDLSWTRAIVEGSMSVEIGRWLLLCLGVLLVLVPASRRAVRERVGGLALLAVFFVFLQRKEMAFFFDLVPGASKLQFPSRLLVFTVPIVVTCTAVAVEAALRSADPVARIVGRALPFVAAAGQFNLSVVRQRSIWGTQIDAVRIHETLTNPRDVTTGKLAMFESWDLFLPHTHGGAAPAPFLEASEGCTVSSPRLTHGARAHTVPDNVQCDGVSFVVHGPHCSVKVNQYHTPLLRFEMPPPAATHSEKDGTTVLDGLPDGAVVRIRERSVFDLARKWLLEKARRRP
jgi:hypothetical protein